MTLKEKVAEVEPERTYSVELSIFCPSDFTYLNQNDVCPRSETGVSLSCRMCWNRDYKEAPDAI